MTEQGLGAAQDFGRWREEFAARATAQGVAPSVVSSALRGVAPDPRVLELDGRQPEFTRPIWDYIDSAVSERRVADGRRLAAEKAAELAEIERRHRVPREIVLAIWGGESGYGANYGDMSVIRSLATLAWEGRRRDFGEEQLLAALRIVEAGDVTPAGMVGSWAGAMGHTQFIPTSYLAYAVDHDGDGRRDLWSADALDALASTANYLSSFGWRWGEPWFVEVRLPAGVDPGLADGAKRPEPFWRGLGLARADGAPLHSAGDAELLLPAGARGPAFLTYHNFDVIKRYNNATSYALAIGHLADRIAGGGPFLGDWPRGDRPLSRSEKEEMQQRLAAAGFDPGAADGVVGPDTRTAIRGWQRARGLPADGYDSAALLEALRREAPR
nr:lytic murein transglycosylase [Rubrimonas cliftonensis]